MKIQTKLENGKWVEAIPIPYYGFKKHCHCGESFWKEENYEKHYVYEHIYLGN